MAAAVFLFLVLLISSSQSVLAKSTSSSVVPGPARIRNASATRSIAVPSSVAKIEQALARSNRNNEIDHTALGTVPGASLSSSSSSDGRLNRHLRSSSSSSSKTITSAVSSKVATTAPKSDDDDTAATSAKASDNANTSGTGWVGLQAITAFFVIIAAVAFALFLRPTTNRSQYQPL